MIMKKSMIKLSVIAVVAIVAGYNVYHSNVETQNLSNITLAEVEAIAACEVSSDTNANKGICLGDVSNGNDYCVTGSIWASAPKCSETI